jgi:hypothetical protein
MDENRFGGSIMANGSESRQTPGSIVGDTALRIATGNLRDEQEFQQSALGEALFYLPSMIMGAQIGGAVEKTMEPLTDLIKNRREAKELWNSNAIMPSGKPIQQEYDTFRDFYRTDIKLRARKDVAGIERGEKLAPGIDDQYDGTIIDQLNVAGELDTSPDLGIRSGKSLIDKNKMRAFYLNSIKDYQYNPIEDKTEQLTPRLNLFGGNAPVNEVGPVQMAPFLQPMMPKQPEPVRQMGPAEQFLSDVATSAGARGQTEAKSMLDLMAQAASFGRTLMDDMRQFGIVNPAITQLGRFNRSYMGYNTEKDNTLKGYGFDTFVDPTQKNN